MALALRSAAVESDLDDHLSSLDYQKISALITTETGIKLPPAKRLMVEGRLRKRLRLLGFESFDSYCDYLFHNDGLAAERPYIINAVTTNKTDFFREPEHFSLLENELVPNLLRARKGTRNPLIKVWSAASSVGAEAYTIAMVLNDLMSERRDFRYAILGTDISTAVLALARRAVYPAEMLLPVPAEKQARYVMHARKPGLRPDVRIVPELRQRVHFDQLNLMDERYPYDHDVDVIFLRNVLIYFEKIDQERVIGRLIEHLRPGGYLILGHSESMIGTSITMRQVAPAVFQRTEGQ